MAVSAWRWWRLNRTRVLLYVLGFLCFRLLMREEKPQEPEEPDSHLFVVKSFIYSEGHGPTDTVMTLFNSERLHWEKLLFTCRRRTHGGYQDQVRGTVLQLIHGPRQCKQTLFRLTCPFPKRPRQRTVAYSVGVKNAKTRQTEFADFSVSLPDRRRRGLVTCMSRMLAFDDWALVVFAMEAIRIYGGELVVAPVNCARKQVFDLLKLYEADGLVHVVKGYSAGHPEGVPYHPDMQSEYTHQMTSAHECFYEHKQSAEFISFTDWDDILVGSRTGSRFHLLSNLRRLAHQFPLAAAFQIDRSNTYVQRPLRPAGRFYLTQVADSLQLGSKRIDEKLVIRPARVAGAWIHKIKEVEDPRFVQVAVNRSDVFFMHVHDVSLDTDQPITSTLEEILIEKVRALDGKLMDLSFSRMLRRHDFAFNRGNYPYFKLFHSLIFKCYADMDVLVQKDVIPYCPTYLTCNYPTQNNISVVRIETTHRKPQKIAHLIWHERESVKFVEASNGCL